MQDKTSILQLERLRELIDSSGKTRQELANDLGCDNSTITKHYNGDRAVTTEYLVKYAKYFNVTADYLLGLTNVKTTNAELKSVCDYIGLSEAAVRALKQSLSWDSLYDVTDSFLRCTSLFSLIRGYITQGARLTQEIEEYQRGINQDIEEITKLCFKDIPADTALLPYEIELIVKDHVDFIFECDQINTNEIDLLEFKMQQEIHETLSRIEEYNNLMPKTCYLCAKDELAERIIECKRSEERKKQCLNDIE